MRFYTHQHQYYCGIAVSLRSSLRCGTHRTHRTHTSMMYVCIHTDAVGTPLLHRNLRTDPEAPARVLEPYREDLAVAVECVFVWYWIADL